MKTGEKGIILYGILNWGLGHATRSESIIRALEGEGFEVVIASDGQALDFLKKTFPHNRFHTLRGYGIKYGRGSSQLGKLAFQIPKMLKTAMQENGTLKQLVRDYKPVGVISDNRLGWYHNTLPSVYITHQLKLTMPVFPGQVSKLHHFFINRYTECWVPDLEGNDNLSGVLGHGFPPKIPLRFIGPQSRFGPGSDEAATEKKYDIAVILSGPEPQRSVLEQKLLTELRKRKGHWAFIRGTESGPDLNFPENTEVINLADAETVKQVALSSKMVISRSGYSSIMDYYYLGNRALLIPTPGQPEQEYLARYQLHMGRFGYTSQSYLNLDEDLRKAGQYDGFKEPELNFPDWKKLFRLFEGKGKG